MMRLTFALLFFLTFAGSCFSEEVIIPRISQRVRLEDFLGMAPAPNLAGQFAVVENFVESSPSDGSIPSQKTVVYLAYDQDNLYVIFVCFDRNSEKIVASISRREGFGEDEDWVEFYIDTFNDQRRAYCFSTNALGIQWDSRYSETTSAGGDFQGHQPSFDALWYSEGKVTDRGYISFMTIPFKSIRFPSADQQTWRILFGRSIPRNNEYSAWPHMSKSIQGYLTQSSILTGLQNISPGRSLQFIPYSSFRAFRLLDTEASPPGFISDRSHPSAGVDTKFVLKDSFVFDFAFNPDFSQVESDQPQVTVNQRFEVFFREKRPFFLENAQYFETPLNLVFTRRIADPQYGGRFTGKYGAYTLGLMLTNDEAPGKVVPEESPLSGTKANFGIVRLSRDFFRQSSVGLLYTGRELEGSANSVAGVDYRLRVNDHWQTTGQAVRSWTNPADGKNENGAAYFANATRTGEKFGLEIAYTDRSPDFITLTGFIPRVDFREISSATHYYFRPEGNSLVAYGPEFNVARSWDYDGTRLDSLIQPGFYFEFQRRTFIHVSYLEFQQQIRPKDFPGLSGNLNFDTPLWHFAVSTSYWKWGTVELTYERGNGVNFEPVENQVPAKGNINFLEATLRIRPLQRLQIQNSYLFTGLKSEQQETIFNNHIVSIRSNYQFTKALSLRLIFQYDATIVNPAFTSLEDRRNFNADVLITYMLNPWTALYVGYNGNRQNLDLLQEQGIPYIVRTHGVLLNDANQFFMKFSYLLRL
jgi:hypothetical protein